MVFKLHDYTCNFQNLKKQIKLNQIQHLIETNIAIVINCFTKLKNIF
jgi:hypothetical protein